jgi:hypothetical protein
METNANQPGYLCVDRFLAHFMDAQALGAAFELGVIDCLERESSHTIESLCQRLERMRESFLYWLIFYARRACCRGAALL